MKKHPMEIMPSFDHEQWVLMWIQAAIIKKKIARTESSLAE
ncbi:MAG: hypothetical protein AAF620_13885 [Bacteroidota bacterium]